MKRSRNSKKVSWALGVKLCQVKLFSSEDCPAKIGSNLQDHLQAKTSWMLHSDVIGSNELPPGFEASTSTKHLKKELHRIPQIRWSCPPKFIISHNWQVVAGEESKEVEAQKLRASRMLEAVYPRPSAIPPSPSVSLDIENERYDDSLTPLVPINPIEEEDSEDLPSEPTVDLNNLVCSQPSASGPMNIPTSSAPAAPASEKSAPGISHVGADVIAAASTALAAIMKSNQQGSLIDTDLLIKILSDPKMIQNLISDHPPPPTPVNPAVNPPANAVSAPANTATPPANAVSAPANTAATANAGGVSMIVSKPVTALVHTSSVSVSKPDTQRAGDGNLHPVLNGFRPTLNPIPPQPPQLVPSIAMSCPEPSRVLLTKHANGNLNPVPNLVRPILMPAQPITGPMSSFTVMEAQPVKDANYYKNLIRQHGGEKRELQEQPMLGQNGDFHNHLQDLKLIKNVKPGDVKPRIQKRCIYFNGPRGCRNGLSCPFQHDVSNQWRTGSVIEAPSAKKVRLGGEITGKIL